MKTIAEHDIANGFAHLLAAAAEEPVAIQRHGQPDLVILSATEYARLAAAEAAEDAYWIRQAEAGQASGYVGPEETEKFFRDALGA